MEVFSPLATQHVVEPVDPLPTGGMLTQNPLFPSAYFDDLSNVEMYLPLLMVGILFAFIVVFVARKMRLVGDALMGKSDWDALDRAKHAIGSSLNQAADKIIGEKKTNYISRV